MATKMGSKKKNNNILKLLEQRERGEFKSISYHSSRIFRSVILSVSSTEDYGENESDLSPWKAVNL